MRGKALIVVVAIALGAAAAFATFIYLNTVRRDAEAGNRMTEVLVAVRDVPRGATAEELLASGAVERTKIPQRYVAQGAISSVRSVEDRVLAVSLSKGEILTAQRFQFRTEAGLAFSVPKDYVALTIPVNEARGVAGLLKPGDRVAVVATIDTKTGVGDETRIIIPGTRVLAVGRTTETTPQSDVAAKGQQRSAALGSGGSQAPVQTTNVTVALSAVDVERVVLSIEDGQVWLALLPSTQSSAGPGPGQNARTVLR